MLTLHSRDRLIVKSLNVAGVVCQKNTEMYYVKTETDGSLRCSLGIDDPIEATFLIKPHHILQAYDSITNELVYRHTPSDAL